MRADMAKVIVERPRYGSRRRAKDTKGYRKRLSRMGEDLPKHEGIKRPYGWDIKHLNEHLGPLRRYLQSQVGRPWDRVFSELCKHINRNNPVQDHVRDHVEDFVETSVIIEDGIPFATPDRERGWRRYLWSDRPLRQELYVCPRTGLLKRTPRVSRKPKPSTSHHRPVRLDKTHFCKVIDGEWCLVTVRPIPADRTLLQCKNHDVVLNKSVTMLSEHELRREYGARVYAVAYRRLAKKELSQYPIPSNSIIPS